MLTGTIALGASSGTDIEVQEPRRLVHRAARAGDPAAAVVSFAPADTVALM